MSIIWLVWSAARILCHQSLQPRRIRCWRQILKDPPSNSTSPSCECPPPCAFLHATHHLCQKICWHVSVSVRKCRLQEEFNSSWLILAWQPCFSAATQRVSERFLLQQRCVQVEKVHRGEGEESISGRASWSAYGLRVLSKRAAETAKNGRRKIRSQEM